MDLVLIRSSSFSFRRILFILSSVSVSIFFLILEKDEIINSSYIIFLSIFFISIIFLVKSGNAFHLFYPGSILAMYVLLSHGLGSWAFANEYVLPYRFYEDWTGLENLGLASFLISTSCVLILFFQSYFLPINEVKKSDFVKKDINYKKIIISFFIFAFLYQFLDNLSFLGGDGSFKQIAVLYFSCFLFYEFSKINSSYIRLFFSFLIIILVSIISVDDKRDAIFLMLPFLFCEMYRLNFKISFKAFIGLIIFSFFTGFLIICMSLMRGYGSYEISSLIDLLFFCFHLYWRRFFCYIFF